jgi:hypothetical protein
MQRHVVLRVSCVNHNPCTDATGAFEAFGLVEGPFAPRASEDIVHRALIIREIQEEQPVVREDSEFSTMAEN